MKLRKRLLAAASAAVLLGTLVSSVSARNLSLSNQNIRSTFREVRLSGLFGGIPQCQMTLEGSFHSRTLPKVTGSLIGYVTSAILGPCTTGAATILRETLPWHVRYSGFAGLLPSITTVTAHVVGFAWRIREPSLITCLFRSTATEPVIETYTRNTTTRAITEATIGGTISSGLECENLPGTFTSDRGRVSVSGTATTLITVSLI